MFWIHVDPSYRISTCKQKIERMRGIPPENVRLALPQDGSASDNDVPLTGDFFMEKTLESLGINESESETNGAALILSPITLYIQLSSSRRMKLKDAIDVEATVDDLEELVAYELMNSSKLPEDERFRLYHDKVRMRRGNKITKYNIKHMEVLKLKFGSDETDTRQRGERKKASRKEDHSKGMKKSSSAGELKSSKTSPSSHRRGVQRNTSWGSELKQMLNNSRKRAKDGRESGDSHRKGDQRNTNWGSEIKSLLNMPRGRVKDSPESGDSRPQARSSSIGRLAKEFEDSRPKGRSSSVGRLAKKTGKRSSSRESGRRKGRSSSVGRLAKRSGKRSSSRESGDSRPKGRSSSVGRLAKKSGKRSSDHRRRRSTSQDGEPRKRSQDHTQKSRGKKRDEKVVEQKRRRSRSKDFDLTSKKTAPSDTRCSSSRSTTSHSGKANSEAQIQSSSRRRISDSNESETRGSRRLRVPDSPIDEGGKRSEEGNPRRSSRRSPKKSPAKVNKNAIPSMADIPVPDLREVPSHKAKKPSDSEMKGCTPPSPVSVVPETLNESLTLCYVMDSDRDSDGSGDIQSDEIDIGIHNNKLDETIASEAKKIPNTQQTNDTNDTDDELDAAVDAKMQIFFQDRRERSKKKIAEAKKSNSKSNRTRVKEVKEKEAIRDSMVDSKIDNLGISGKNTSSRDIILASLMEDQPELQEQKEAPPTTEPKEDISKPKQSGAQQLRERSAKILANAKRALEAAEILLVDDSEEPRAKLKPLRPSLRDTPFRNSSTRSTFAEACAAALNDVEESIVDEYKTNEPPGVTNTEEKESKAKLTTKNPLKQVEKPQEESGQRSLKTEVKPTTMKPLKQVEKAQDTSGKRISESKAKPTVKKLLKPSSRDAPSTKSPMKPVQSSSRDSHTTKGQSPSKKSVQDRLLKFQTLEKENDNVKPAAFDVIEKFKKAGQSNDENLNVEAKTTKTINTEAKASRAEKTSTESQRNGSIKDRMSKFQTEENENNEKSPKVGKESKNDNTKARGSIKDRMAKFQTEEKVNPQNSPSKSSGYAVPTKSPASGNSTKRGSIKDRLAKFQTEGKENIGTGSFQLIGLQTLGLNSALNPSKTANDDRSESTTYSFCCSNDERSSNDGGEYYPEDDSDWEDDSSDDDELFDTNIYVIGPDLTPFEIQLDSDFETVGSIKDAVSEASGIPVADLRLAILSDESNINESNNTILSDDYKLSPGDILTVQPSTVIIKMPDGKSKLELSVFSGTVLRDIKDYIKESIGTTPSRQFLYDFQKNFNEVLEDNTPIVNDCILRLTVC